MKNQIIYLILFSAVLLACQAPVEENSDLASLNAQKAELKAEYDKLSQQISDVEAKIAEMDTTRKAPLVSLYTVGTKSFDTYFSIQGNMEAEENALVYPELNGAVKSIRVREGDRVSKGQVIVELDTELISKSIREVETQYELAQDMYERQKNLWDQKIGSEAQYLQAKTQKEALENSLATLNEQKDMGKVRAPFAGTVDEIVPKIGEMANPMMHVTRVINLNKMYIDADVSEKYYHEVAAGNPVKVIAGPDTLHAEIQRVGKYIKPENRTFQIRLDLDNNDGRLIPNQLAKLEISNFHKDSVVVLPAHMLIEDARGNAYVYIASKKGGETIVSKKIIDVKEIFKGEAWVDGLSAGDMIVDKGSKKAVDGKAVRLVSEQNNSTK